MTDSNMTKSVGIERFFDNRKDVIFYFSLVLYVALSLLSWVNSDLPRIEYFEYSIVDIKEPMNVASARTAAKTNVPPVFT